MDTILLFSEFTTVPYNPDSFLFFVCVSLANSFCFIRQKVKCPFLLLRLQKGPQFLRPFVGLFYLKIFSLAWAPKSFFNWRKFEGAKCRPGLLICQCLSLFRALGCTISTDLELNLVRFSLTFWSRESGAQWGLSQIEGDRFTNPTVTCTDAHQFDVAAVLFLWGPRILMQVLAPVSDRCDQRLHELFPLETTAVAEANGWQRCHWAPWERSAWPSSASGRAFKLDANNPTGWVLVAIASVLEMGGTQEGE